MNRVIETYADFRIDDNLPENWVRNLWMNNGFTTYVSFPAEFEIFLEEIAISDVMNEFHEALQDWFRSSGMSFKEIIVNYTNADSGFSQECEMNWQTLINEGIDYKPIICILGTLVLRFLDDSTNLSYFVDALIAARLYLFLMAIPGSHICQIFNSTLYSHVMSMMKMCCEQIDGCSSPKGKGVKRKKSDGENDLELDDNESNKLMFDDKSRLISHTNDFLVNLKLIIENKKFKFDDASLSLTVQILLMVARLEKVYSSLLVNNLNNFRKDSVSYLAFKSFNILQNISGMLHSDPNESAKRMIKSISPIFLINELRTLGLSLKDAAIVRVNFTLFLKMLLDTWGEAAYEAVNILVQRICVSVPDRAEMRMKASNIVLDVLKISPPDLLAEEIYSIAFMSHMSETKIRLFTLEIISKLLMETDTNISFSRLPQKYAAVTNHEFLLAIIFYRCQDVSTGVRTKALSYLDQFISSASSNKRVKKVVDKIFLDPYVAANNVETVPAYNKDIFDTQQFLLEERFLDDRSLDPLPGVKVVLDMLVYFSQEDKVFIKKCAVQTLARLMLFNEKWIKKELLQVYLVCCDDSSILIRKTVGQIITDLLSTYSDNADVIHCWVEGVVPMIAEEEVKAQEKIIEHFTKIILTNIMMFEHTTSVVSRLPWLVMKQILALDKRSYLHFAVGKWVQNKAVKNRTIQMIYSHLETENNSVAWCLLVSFSQFMDLPNANIIHEHYKRVLANYDSVQHSQLVFETLYYVCPSMPKETKRELLEELEIHLTNGVLPLKLIARSRDICELILNCSATSKENAHPVVIQWSSPKIKICIEYIKSQIGNEAPIEIVNIDKLVKFVFLLGELAQAAPSCVTKGDIKLLENILLSPKKREDWSWKGRACNALKAVTILTLVKLVLQKEEMANSIMPIFREILSSNSVDPTIQVNTIIGMCDLCSRYTTLVERYFTFICKCFNSKHENVRMTALMSVMKRVKEEYVKLRPFILFPMLTMILDESVSVKRAIASFIGVDLKKKNNVLETFYTGIFYFLNNCKNHSTTVKIPEDLRVMFSLTDRPEDREYIYTYILDKLADPHKRLLVCKKIVSDIVLSVADETMKLDEKTENILTDAFSVLVDNEKKISEAITRSKKSNTEEVEEIEEINEVNREPKKAQGSAATTINENVRLNEANEIVPTIIKLRLLLKKHKSRCMTGLMSYMCELMKNFKNEMADLLQGDIELKAEIEFSLRRIELEEDRKRAESQEAADSHENRIEDENRNIEVLTTSPEEICEQLQNLIVQLTRCDAEPIIKLSKNDASCINNAESNTEVNSLAFDERMETEEIDGGGDKPCERELVEPNNVSPQSETENMDKRFNDEVENNTLLKRKFRINKRSSRRSNVECPVVKSNENKESHYSPQSQRWLNKNEKRSSDESKKAKSSENFSENETCDIVSNESECTSKSSSKKTLKSEKYRHNHQLKKNISEEEAAVISPKKSRSKHGKSIVNHCLILDGQKGQSRATGISTGSQEKRIVEKDHRKQMVENDGAISSEKQPTVLDDANVETEWMENDVEINDDPIEEGCEMFSSDED